MAAIKFTYDSLAATLGAAKPVPVPVPEGATPSMVRSTSLASESCPTTRAGVWECSPGRWRRQVLQAEFCHFLAGECTFHPDEGEPIEIRAGDIVYFPEASGGVWDIRQPSRKIFILFDEGAKR